MADDDPNWKIIRDDYLVRMNPQASGELSDLDFAEAALKAAGEELEDLVKEISPDWQTALNESEGRTNWNDLTTEQKVAQVEESGQSIADLMKSGVIQECDEEDLISKTPWSDMDLEQKLDAVDQRGDRSVVQLVRKGAIK